MTCEHVKRNANSHVLTSMENQIKMDKMSYLLKQNKSESNARLRSNLLIRVLEVLRQLIKGFISVQRQ